MKIVIPTDDKKGLDSKITEHFGRCKTYTFLDENGTILEIIDNTSEHMGGQGLPPELMKKNNANVLLCRGLGSRALDLCQKYGIKVYVKNVENVKNIFEMWKENQLQKATSDDVCEDHEL